MRREELLVVVLVLGMFGVRYAWGGEADGSVLFNPGLSPGFLGHSWSEVSNIHAGFAETLDDEGVTSEVDSLISANIGDEVSWGKISDKLSFLFC